MNALLSLLFAAAATLPIHIDAARIEAHMKVLAGDRYQGRETGTPGYDAAAAYVAEAFRNGGAFMQYQPIAFRRAVIDEKQSTLSIGETPLTIGKDFVMRGATIGETLDASAPVVFAGFGVVAPELKHDDYAHLDAKGKIVAILTGAPPSFPHDQRAYYSSGEVKRRLAAEHGAIAILSIRGETDEKRFAFEKMAAQMPIPSMMALDPDGKPLSGDSRVHGAATLSHEAAARLFAHAPIPFDRVLADAEKGVAHSFALDTAAALHQVSVITKADSENVIGTVRGTDETLSKQTVVVTAHLDHLGNHPPAGGGDGIYNGALDNASGVACLIEMATAVARHPLKRTVVFVALTGEEKGELGSEYYARYPNVPRESIVANVNMDMFMMLFPVRDVVVLGAEHSSLGPIAEDAAKANGFEIEPDPLPEEVRFIRSDQYSFVKEGIPAITIKAGDHSSDPTIDGPKITKEWLRTVYHTPKDDMSQHLDFASGARFAETNLRLVEAIANAKNKPRWKVGDFFERLFVASKRKATITLRQP